MSHTPLKNSGTIAPRTTPGMANKHQDDSSASLLSAVISTLSKSRNKESTESEKSILTQNFHQSDARLDSLLAEHYTKLKTLIDAFTKISARLHDSRERVSSMKEKLYSCKDLLHCQRDDLRRFWLDGLEQNTIVATLGHIEDVKGASDKITLFMSKRKYLHATDVLDKAISLLRGDLSDVHALRGIAQELELTKASLITNIISQLNEVIYTTSTSTAVMTFQRFGSMRASAKGKGASVKASATEQSILDTNHEIVEDPDERALVDRSHYIAILVECLAKLSVIPDVIAQIRANLERKLFEVIDTASSQSLAKLKAEMAPGQADDPLNLLDLLEFLFEQFRCVVHAHNVIIRNMRRIKQSSKYNCKSLALYDISEVWNKVQVVLQKLLESYFKDDSQRPNRRSRQLLSDDAPVSQGSKITDVSDYFNRRQVRQKKALLFSFGGTLNSASLAEMESNQKTELFKKGESVSDSVFHPGALTLICKPSVTNIVYVYKCIESFTNEIEMASGCEIGECALAKYITAFIKNKFNAHIREEISSFIKKETEGFDSLKNLIDSKRQRELSSTRPLLQSAVTVIECVLRLAELMQGLPDYCDYFLNMLIKTLDEYLHTVRKQYTDVVRQSPDSELLSISATWATDDDISRFLRSLPNWQNVQTTEERRMNISEEEMRALNLKESQILTSNLSESHETIPTQEILSDPVQLKLISHLQESMEWLTFQLERFLGSIPASGKVTQEPHLDIPEIEDITYKNLRQTVNEYRELSDTCLLVLHLEVRLHCFYHLTPMAQQSNYYCAIDDLDADPNAVNLNRDLTHLEEVIKGSVQYKKFRYIFEGLGHLVSSLLINSVQFIKKINDNGVKKMCRNIFAIQQSLTNVTSYQEVDLELARQYYELLNMSIDQIINVIMEQGAKFTELEYTHLMALLKRSQPKITDQDFGKQKLKLKQVITEKQVYVV